jgi:hypothetical protein
MSALARAGLVIERMVEFPYANGWRGFQGMRDVGGRRLAPPDDSPRIPMMYGIVAAKLGP